MKLYYMTKWHATNILTLIVMLLSCLDGIAQNQYLIKGRVADVETREPLIGASVRCGKTGVATDTDGNYVLLVKGGTYNIECSYIGYNGEVRRAIVKCDTVLNFDMQSSSNELSEVVILSRSVMDRIRNTQPGMERINLDEMSKTPVLFGERDILRIPLL